MKKFILALSIIAIFQNNNAQVVISQFDFDANPVTTATVGPNASSVSSSAVAASYTYGGSSGVGIATGIPSVNIELTIPNTGGVLDVPGIDISIDYQRDEGVGNLVLRGSSLRMTGGGAFQVIYRVDNGSGGFNTVTSAGFTIPFDNVMRTYRFVYLPSTGVGTMYVDGAQIWTNDGPDNRNMYWTGAGDMIIGNGIDNSGTNQVSFDNLVIGSVTNVALPIELIDFNAKLDNNNVYLNWSTATEINNDYFTIERSLDGLDWEKLTKINGAGNSSSILNYNTVDKNPYSGTSYYRLKQTDFNGDFAYSGIISVRVTGFTESTFEIYPNPTKDKITLSGDLSSSQEIKVYDVLGRNVTNQTSFEILGEDKLVLDLTNLLKGTYFIEVNNQVSKLCKN